MQTEFLCISVFRIASAPRLKVAGRKSAFNPRWFILLSILRRLSRCWFYSLLLCGLFYEAFYILPCVIYIFIFIYLFIYLFIYCGF